MTTAELVARALTMANLGEYQLGTGNYNPAGPDVPWTKHHKTGKVGADCAGFVIWVHKLRRHRPGFGKGPGARVVDDLNSDSINFDSHHAQELFTTVTGPPLPGDLLIIPSRFDASGERVKIGHVMLVTANRALEWDGQPRPWDLVEIIHCRGPNGKRPGVVVTDASLCARHDAKWLKVPAMQTQVVRMRVSEMEGR